MDTVGEGGVDSAAGWYGEGQGVTSTASADPYFAFVGWSGNTAGDTNGLSMSVDMDGPKSLVAQFWAEVTTNGVPVTWLAAHGLTNGTPEEAAMSDRFGKGMPAWQEFYAGTDPEDPESVFRIIEFGTAGGSNYVVWIGGTNGSTRPFEVLGCPELTGDWSVLDGNVSRSPSGTNAWWSAGADSNQFYRINVETGE
jgi:hypothetical protein